MTSALPLPRPLRHPSWFLPLLLPALPALALAWRGTGDVSNPAPTTALVILLLGIGTLIAFGLPALADFLPPAARKEIELLRPTWIASLFVVQVPLALGIGNESASPLLPGGELEDLPHMLFFATCALLAAIPFGLEFQQRTIGALLSQPVRRADWWLLKSSCLASALALHTLIYGITLLATGHPTPPLLGLALPLGAAIAWSTTPAWTLRTRSLLPGLVLAIATPILASTAIATLADAVVRFELLTGPRTEDWITTCGTTLALAAYAALSHRAARHHWDRLEAIDSDCLDANPSPWAALLGLPAQLLHRSSTQTAPSPHPCHPWSALLSKELRLQVPTTGLLLLTTALAALALLTADNTWIQDYLRGTLLLVAAATLVCAGALPIAEERRLGTFDAGRLTPGSRTTQAWIKLLPGLALASIATLLGIAGASAASGIPTVANFLTAALAAATLFTASFLASSTANHGLRAAVAGTGHAVATLALVGLTLITVARQADQAGEVWRERMLRQPAALREEVAALDGVSLGRILDDARPGTSPAMAATLACAAAGAALPCLLALLLARINLDGPTPSRSRAGLQVAACLALTATACAAALALSLRAGESDQRARTLASVYRCMDWEKTLSPAQHLLWQRHRPANDPFSEYAEVPVQGLAAGNRSNLTVPFPLPASLRDYLLANARLDDEVRTLLRQEADAHPAVRRLPPIPQPPRGSMTRYGLIPSTPATPQAQPAPPTNTQPPR